MESEKYAYKKRGMNMKRELIECYYEAHMKEIQESVNDQDIREVDDEISLLNQELCGGCTEKRTGVLGMV